MPPQIKHDLNRSGWESTDFPSVCESCLPENPYVQIIKEDHGAECKIVNSFPIHSVLRKAILTIRSVHVPILSFVGRPIEPPVKSDPSFV